MRAMEEAFINNNMFIAFGLKESGLESNVGIKNEKELYDRRIITFKRIITKVQLLRPEQAYPTMFHG